MLKLAHLKFPAVGNEANTMLVIAPALGVDVLVTRQPGYFKRTYIQLDATSPRGQQYIGNVYSELRRVGRA